MASIFNALAGLAMQNRRPNYRTPGINPRARQTYPYPDAGPVPPVVGSDPTAMPSPTDVQAPTAEESQKSWLSRVYDGLTSQPGQAFTLTMANGLARPRQHGETGMGQVVNSITQGYSALGMLANARRAEQERLRKAGIEDRETRVKERGADTAAATQTATEAHQTDSRAVDRERIGAEREDRTARSAQDQRQHDQEMARLDKAAASAEIAALKAQQAADRQYALDQKKLEKDTAQGTETARHNKAMESVARSNAAANNATARAAVLRAQRESEGKLTPQDMIKIQDDAVQEAAEVLKIDFGADSTKRQQIINDIVKKKVQMITGMSQPPPLNRRYKEGDTATGPNGQKAVFRGGKWVVK